MLTRFSDRWLVRGRGYTALVAGAIFLTIALFKSAQAHVDLIGFEGVHIEVERQWKEVMRKENVEADLHGYVWFDSDNNPHDSQSESRGTVGQND